MLGCSSTCMSSSPCLDSNCPLAWIYSLPFLGSNVSHQAVPPQEHTSHSALSLTPCFGTLLFVFLPHPTQALTLYMGQPFYRDALSPCLGSDTSCQANPHVDTLLNPVELRQCFQGIPAMWAHSSPHLDSDTPL